MRSLRVLPLLIPLLAAGCVPDNGGYYRDNHSYDDDRNHQRSFDRDRGDGNDEIITCESQGQRRQTCHASIGHRDRVYLVNRTSRSDCDEGSDWGWNREGIWVDNGCRAQFRIDHR